METVNSRSEGYTFTGRQPHRADWADSGHGDNHWPNPGAIGTRMARLTPIRPHPILARRGRLHEVPLIEQGASPRSPPVRRHRRQYLLLAPLPLGLDCSGVPPAQTSSTTSTIWDEKATYDFLDPVEFPSGLTRPVSTSQQQHLHDLPPGPVVRPPR